MKWQELSFNQQKQMGRPMTKGGKKKQTLLNRENPVEMADAIENFGNAPTDAMLRIKSKVNEIGEIDGMIRIAKPGSLELMELRLRRSYLVQVIKNYGVRYIKAKLMED